MSLTSLLEVDRSHYTSIYSKKLHWFSHKLFHTFPTSTVHPLPMSCVEIILCTLFTQCGYEHPQTFLKLNIQTAIYNITGCSLFLTVGSPQTVCIHVMWPHNVTWSAEVLWLAESSNKINREAKGPEHYYSMPVPLIGLEPWGFFFFLSLIYCKYSSMLVVSDVSTA